MADPDAQKAKRAIEEQAKGDGLTKEEVGTGLAGARSHNILLERQIKKTRWIENHQKKTGMSYREAEKAWRQAAQANRKARYEKPASERNPYHVEKKTLPAKQEVERGKAMGGGSFEVDTTRDIYTRKQGTPIDDAVKLARRAIEQFAKKRGIDAILRGGEIFAKKTANPALAMYGVNDVQGGNTRQVNTPTGKANEFWTNGQLQQVIVDKGDGKYQIIKNPKKLKEYAEQRTAEHIAAADIAAPRVDPAIDNRAREDF